MAEQGGLKKVVERVVSRVLEEQLPRLRDQLVASVLQEVASGSTSGSQTTSGDLLRAVALVHTGSTQREILRALLDSSTQYCSRVALFVVKSGAASGWQGRGFEDDNFLKDFPFDLNSGLGARVFQDRTPALGKASDVDSAFIERFKPPAQNQAMLLPLMLKDKIAALVYADGSIDAVALELLTLATSAWLEVAALRKQAPREGAPESAAPVERAQTPVPVETVSSFNDPFAGHSPRHVMTIPSPQPRAERVAEADAPVVSAAAAAAAAPLDPNLSPEDADTHRKAQRFAKLLVDEIKLYNQAKVNEGRKHKDLYDRLKEDIDKSRATYQRRYGNTAAASGDYFNGEVVRSLGGDDPSVMGANFRH